jgi:lipopolysaccharide export system permease protein
MNTLDRYVVVIFARNFLLAAVGLVALYLFQALLTQLFDNDYQAIQVIIYNLMGLPQVLVQMVPPGVLIASVLTLSGLNRSNELTACYSIGIGLSRIVMVMLAIVFTISCLSLVMQDRILPPLFKTQTNYYWRVMQKKNDFFLDLKQNKIWYRSKNVIYNLRSFDAPSNTIFGMTVYTFDDEFNLVQVMEAEKADYTRQGWLLRNGTVTVFASDDPFPMTKRFAQKELIISERPKDFQEIEKEVDALRLKELYSYIKKTRSTGIDTKKFEVKLQSKISLSFIPMVMCILAVPFSVRNRREGGLAKDLGLCLGFTFFYWLFYSIGLSLGSNGALPPWLAAWLPSVIFAVVAVTLIARRSK